MFDSKLQFVMTWSEGYENILPKNLQQPLLALVSFDTDAINLLKLIEICRLWKRYIYI